MKNPPYLKTPHKFLAMSLAILASAFAAQAQNAVFYENFETDHSADGTYVTNQTAGSVNHVNLYFDYSTAGIPLSPSSTNSTTRALKMAANLSGNVFGGVSVSPVNFGITDNFDMRFDAWFNFNGPFPGGGNGSTQVGGAGYGTAGTFAQTAGVADSIFIGGTADGGSSADYRVYSPWHPISYQDGSYRIGSDGTNATTLGDPASGLVYARTNRNAQPAYDALFPAQQCPTNQFTLYPQQTNSNGTLPGAPGFANAGNLAFKWHDISLKKLGNTITYSIDGFLIATVDVNDAGPLGGTNILFNQYDINATSSTDVNDSNLCFTLIDNVRITNYANVVTVFSTNKPVTFETNGTPVPGVFTIVRSDSANPVTINYTLTGSAVNGVDYATLSGSVVIAAGSLSTNIFVTPIDDSEPETTEAVVLDIAPGAYIGGGSATINIVDNEPGQLAITNISSQVYERTNDFGVFRITRLGATNAPSFPVNLTFTGGSATSGTDFYMTNTVAFDVGFQSTNFVVLPIEDYVFEGNETITVNIAPASGGEYTIGAAGSASLTLVDADSPPETVLFSDNFDVDSAANYDVFFATTNGAATDDYTILFAQDYTVYGIPVPAPHSAGTTAGLVMSVNKLNATPVAAALNAYYKLQNFSGNFAMRFDMSLNTSAGGSATEYAMFGINHSGTKTNWWRSGGTPAGSTFDGLFAAVETDGGATPQYALYSSPTAANNPTILTATNNAGFTREFKSLPWPIAGSPSVNRTNATVAPYWADVELKKIGSVVTLSINKKPILNYTNTTAFTSGKIMLGYLDAFDSIGDANGNFVVYDNLRVISLASPNITSIVPGSPNLTIQFTANAAPADVPSQFVVQSAGSVAGPYTDVGVAGAGITSPSAGNFTAVVAVNPLDTQKYYRVRRVY